ncbi:MAG: hypothetical protein RJA22_2904 [Verrucomicrobiota bacterium]|jgi:integrase
MSKANTPSTTPDTNPTKHQFRFQGRLFTLVKRDPGRMSPWHLNAMIRRKRIRVSLETNVAIAAEKLAIGNYLEPALRNGVVRRRIEKPAAAPTGSTLGKILSTYGEICRGKLNDQTCHHNCTSFRLVIRRGLRNDSMTNEAIDALPASVLTGKLVADFEDYMAKAGLAAHRDRESTKRTVAGYLRQARSLFKRTTLPRYAELGVALPDLTGFMTRATERAIVAERVPPDDEVLEATLKAGPQLRESDRDAYIAWLLGFSSLRRGECSRMEWTWLSRVNGIPHIRVPANSKGRREALIPIDERLWAELEDYRKRRQRGIDADEERYVLPSPRIGQGGPGARLRAQNVFRRVNKWMRALGWTTNHTMHEMRALILSRIRDDYGLDTAQAFGRHKDQRTTQQSYVGSKSLKDVRVRLPVPFKA